MGVEREGLRERGTERKGNREIGVLRERETEREGGTINIPSGIRVIFFFLYRKRNQFLEFLWLTEKHARLYSVLCSVCIVSRGYF